MTRNIEPSNKNAVDLGLCGVGSTESMYQSHEIKAVHLEITSKCNARCPMCLRNVLGGRVNPQLPQVELSLEDIKKIFPHSFVSQLNRLYMCGNYGDPMMATDTDEAFAYFREVAPTIELQMFTNGSGREPEFWQSLARANVKVRFSVDGLEDTNSIYRRGTKWPLIMRSIKTFIAAGGWAEWDFIVFRHNEHQVEDARKLAVDLGVKKFHVKKTGRFFSNTKMTGKDAQEVLGPDGEIEYHLEMPTEQKYLNSALQRETEIIAKFGSLKNFLGVTPIDCKVALEKSVYVSAEGYVFPCCWTANQLYPWYHEPRSTPIWQMLNQLPEGIESLNAKVKSLPAVIESGFFQTQLPASWQQNGFENGRLFVCGKTCGRGFDAFQAQFEQRNYNDGETSIERTAPV